MFEWKEFRSLANDEIRLVPKSRDEPAAENGYAPRYGFAIIHIQDNRDIGVVYLAIHPESSRRQYLTGHLSYGVDRRYKGHYYAAQACKLMEDVALAHGLSRLLIGSGYDNIASRKTILKLGAKPITRNDVPDGTILEELRTNKVDMFVWHLAQQG
jgi:predicted acetyltransferase